MGLVRKVSSVSTLGLIDFRSAKDRTAAHTASMAKEAKKQTKLLKQQVAAPSQPAAAPGWYPVDGVQRFWDGQAWV